MSELNIDTADRDTLEQMATDLEVKFQANTGDDTLRKRIKEQLGDVSPVEAQGGSGQSNIEGGAPAIPQKAVKPKRFEITVATHEQDKQPVQVGVNGRTYVIERGKKVIVPEPVVEVLNNAVRIEYDPRTMEPNPVYAYPFQLHREVE